MKVFNGTNDREQRRIKIENMRQNFRTNISYLFCKYKGDKIISLRKNTHMGSKNIVHKKSTKPTDSRFTEGKGIKTSYQNSNKMKFYQTRLI